MTSRLKGNVLISVMNSDGSQGMKSDQEGYETLMEEYEDYKCSNYSQLYFDKALSGS